MFGIGAQELVVIMVIALLVFGPKRLPELARSLGRGLAEFRRASTDLRQGLSLEDDPPVSSPAPKTPDQAGLDPESRAGEGVNQIAPPQTTEPVVSAGRASGAPNESSASNASSASSGHGDLADEEDPSPSGSSGSSGG